MTMLTGPTRSRMPVFVDAHVHLSQTGLILGGLDLAGMSSRTEVLDAVATFARANADGVILGSGWDETDWPDPALPTLAEIDRAAPGRVVVLSRVDGHSSLVSGAVVGHTPELTSTAGWDDSGRVERDASKLARNTVNSLIGRAQRKSAIARALDAAAAVGIGSVHEMTAPHINAGEDIELIRELAAERDQLEVVPYWGEHVSAGGVEVALELGCAGAAGDLNIDGALGSRTAGLLEPYSDSPGHAGHTYLDAEAVAEHVIACTRAGIQAGFHCIGDAGTGAAADGFRLAAKEVGIDSLVAARHRLEHVEMIGPEQIAVLAECGAVVSAQPAFDAAWGGDDGMYAKRLGSARALAANPLAAIQQAGSTLAFGSDSPVTRFDPWAGVQAAVWHHNAAARLSPLQAFAAHTSGGRLAARQLADAGADTFVEWEFAEPLGPDGLPSLDPDLPTPRCLRTVVAGRTVYQASEEDTRER